MKGLRFLILCTGMFSLIFVTACANNELEERIYNHLEQTAAIEKELSNIHEQLADLEKKENKSYEQIFEESLEDLETLQSIASEALETLDEQGELIQREAEIIKQSRTEFDQINELINDLSETDVIEQAEQLYSAMIKRYELYDQYLEMYDESHEINVQLYQLFFDEKMDIGKFNQLVESSNKTVEQAQNFLAEISEQTATYNDLKISFYELLDFTIVQ